MSEPDLETLPGRMRYAATVLKEANEWREREPGEDQSNRWTPWQLSKYAEAWEDRDREAAELACERATQIKDLSRALQALYYSWAGDMPHHRFAERLIDMGWLKADPSFLKGDPA